MKKTSFLLAISVILCCLNNSSLAFPLKKPDSDNTSTTIIESSIQTTVEQSHTYSNRATAKFFSNDISGALADFNQAINLSPNNPELYLNRGYIKQLSGDYNGAMSDYNTALKNNAAFIFAYNNRGVLKVALGDIKGAFEDYDKALKLNPKYADVYYNRGNLKYMLNDNNGALADYNKAIELNPKDAEAYNNRGVVKKRMDFNVGALSDYSQAIALNPSDSIAYANRGRLKKLYFDNEGAAIDLDQAIALAETQTFIKNVKPLLSKESYIAAIPTIPSKVKVQDQVKPVETMQKLSQNINKETTLAKNNLIQADTTQKAQPVKTTDINKPMPATIDKNLAAGTLSAGVATVQAPVNPEISTNAVKKSPTTNIKLAESYYIRGLQKCVLRDLQGAIADLNKAIEHNSKYADAYYYRAAIRKELGDNEGFKKDYSTAIQLSPSLQKFNDANTLTLING